MSFFKKKSSHAFSALGASPWLLIACWLALGIVFYFDFLIKYRVNFALFYILPILFASRYAGIKHSVGMACAAAALWHYADVSSGYVYASPLFAYWNTVVRLILFILIPTLFYFWGKENVNAGQDALTGLPNRRSFVKTAEYEMKRARRYKHPLSLAFIDLDNFKQVNDKFGHRVGNILLGQFGDAFKKNIRDTDTFARIGGDEFVLLMPETDQASAISVLTRDVNRVLPPLLSGVYASVTLSVGILTCRTIPSSLDEILEISDRLMYAAKKEGKNRIKAEIYDVPEGMNQESAVSAGE